MKTDKQKNVLSAFIGGAGPRSGERFVTRGDPMAGHAMLVVDVTRRKGKFRMKELTGHIHARIRMQKPQDRSAA